MMDCKRALADCEGDLEKATTLLRERGLAKAGKREGRATSEGAIGLVLAGNVGALVDLGCETDFVAMNEKTVALVTSFAQLVADDASIDSAETLMAAKLNGEPLEEVVKSNISTIGENLVIRRVERLVVDGNGVVGGYVHGGKLGVLVGLKTDASGAVVDALAKDLAMHVAAADPVPVALDREGVPPELVEKERDFLIKQAKDSGKPDNIIEKMVDGRIGKYFSEICLLEQAFIKDPDQKVKKIVEAAAKEAGSGIEIAGFVRVKIGEAASE
jgi:elongation factor Ts